MKALHTIVSLTIVFLFFTTISGVYAQEKLYENQLETVYLSTIKEKVFANTFASYNQELLKEGTIKFRKKIRFAKSENELLYFVSNKNTLQLLTTEYLKTLRKAANRSPNSEAFQLFLKDRLPELDTQFTTDTYLEALYHMSRKDTFNGKIDELPSVI